MMWRESRTLIALGIVLALGMTSQVQTEALQPSLSAPDATPAAAGLTVFDEVWQAVQHHFYDPTLRGLQWTAIAEQYRPLAAVASEAERSVVLNRMLAELGASHTGHYTPADPAYYQLLDIFSGALRRELRRVFPDGQVTYPGIGVLTRQIDGKTFVSGVLAGLPAAKGGLVVGDELLAADGFPYQPIQSFATKVGQEVTLQIRREAGGAPQTLTVVPEQIKPNEAFLQAMQKSVRLFHADGVQVGYIHVWSYAGPQYQRLLEREIAAGTLKQADALILDLRDGWGGAQAHYLDLFHHHAPTVTLRERDGEVAVLNVKWRKPVVMLVNGGTRSGKEILAYGFKKYGLGEVVGTRTAGAVLAGRAFLLRDGSLLFLAVADVLVDGQRLEGIGVTPTIEVPFTLEYAQGQDPQLDRAIDLLSRAARG
jgi:carboxyl-terminal processing protease